jgi:hypothetical protein
VRVPFSKPRGNSTTQEELIMAKAGGGGKRRPGLPAPKTVVAEFDLISPARPQAAAAGKVAPRPRKYRVLRTNQMDPYDKPAPMAAVPGEAAAAPAPVSDSFGGTDRRAAKLSIADGAIEEFADVKALIATLPDEETMTRHQPKITKDAASGRVTEEQRNVRLRGFLYAASREKDNDFHLIVGRSPRGQAVYMTMEVSGLPRAGTASRDTLEAARDAYKAFFTDKDNKLPGPHYDFYDPPIPIEIEGSLFFDITHATGPRPGPPSLKDGMPVIWEVHPITKIVFEP